MGRFLNADVLTSTGQGILGNNMFAYCGNNPVNYLDGSGFFRDLSNTILVNDGSSSAGGGSLIGVALPVLPEMVFSVDDLLSGVYNAVSYAYRKYAQSIKSTMVNIQPGNYPVIHHIVPYGLYSTRNGFVQDQLIEAQQIMERAGVNPKTSLYNQVAISASYHASIHTNDYILMVTEPIISLGENASKEQVIAVLWDLRIIIAANDPNALGY